ncbi:hypothetical protein BV22DRAFT_407245 [Leucogyrophana mollusca]|uniref:Uncharacterized protein n=1 Tax=Leucogyrophana mollusca TaxID=85980 RepID=A0ACB8BJM4_9AGAM|nr:hypothetical protein BV22DRAFT_407245 [Leucogyrophana mollusca]
MEQAHFRVLDPYTQPSTRSSSFSPEAVARQEHIFDRINGELQAINSLASSQPVVIKGVKASDIYASVSELFDACPNLQAYETRINWLDDTLVITRPLALHRFTAGFFFALARLTVNGNGNGKGLPTNRYNGSDIQIGGSAAIRLLDGFKNPTCSLYDVNASREATLNDTPTVVIEVGYNVPPIELAFTSGRFVCASLGVVQLVVAIQLKFSDECNRDGFRVLDSLAISSWEPMQVEKFPTWDGPLDTVFRADCSGLSQFPINQYKLVKKLSRGYAQFTARETKVQEIPVSSSPCALDYTFDITYGQLYREPLVADFNKIAMSIPHATIWHLIKDNINV